jgi:hypothetical protein
MTATYAVTMNGRITVVLKPTSGRSIHDELRARTALLDGTRRFALLLQRLPDGVPFDLVDLDSETVEFMQCAGGVGGRFTWEIRRLSADGEYRLEVIGRPARDERATARTDVVRWAEHSTTVRHEEVLDRDEVGELFDSYLASGGIPAPFELRPL